MKETEMDMQPTQQQQPPQHIAAGLITWESIRHWYGLICGSKCGGGIYCYKPDCLLSCEEIAKLASSIELSQGSSLYVYREQQSLESADQRQDEEAPSAVQVPPPAMVATLFEGLTSPPPAFHQRMMVEVPLINGEPPASLAQGWSQMRNCRSAEPPGVSDMCLPHLPEVSGCMHHSYQSTPPPPMTAQEEAAQRRREKNKFRMRALRASETEVARRLRERNKLRMRRLRASQSQVAQRLKERNAFRMRNIRAAGGTDKLRVAQEPNTQVVHLPLQGLAGSDAAGLRWACLCHQLYRPSRQTDDEVERRRERGRLRMRMLRSSETEEQAARRRELNRLRMRQKRNSQKLEAQGT